MTTGTTDRTGNARKKTKITVAIKKEIFDRFCATAKELGLRRDTYLNQVLPEEIDFFLDKKRFGSKAGENLLRTLRSAESDLVKVGITLDTEVAKALTEACSIRYVLRDLFVEDCLNDLEEVLGNAAVLIVNPRTHASPSTYDNIAMNDDDVSSLLSQLPRSNDAAEGNTTASKQISENVDD